MKIVFAFLILIITMVVAFIINPLSSEHVWKVRSIDTMKYSRDLSREKLKDSKFDAIIEKQITDIEETGATHVAIATPYDEEFLPVLKRWVAAARKHNLKVWFRGNFSGWEGWFEYAKIDSEAHIKKSQDFVLKNKDLFENGDIFSSCPECENGSGVNFGDASQVMEYRKFLIAEYNGVKEAFKTINKDVSSNYFSMNGDVAKAVMDKETTKALDGIVVIDHYVLTSSRLENDVRNLSEESGGKIVLGEFGAPIPDIHGNMSEEEQARWVDDALFKLSKIPDVVGINYWVNVGGSTSVWRDNGSPKQAVSILKKHYSKE